MECTLVHDGVYIFKSTKVKKAIQTIINDKNIKHIFPESPKHRRGMHKYFFMYGKYKASVEMDTVDTVPNKDTYLNIDYGTMTKFTCIKPINILYQVRCKIHPTLKITKLNKIYF